MSVYVFTYISSSVVGLEKERERKRKEKARGLCRLQSKCTIKEEEEREPGRRKTDKKK